MNVLWQRVGDFVVELANDLSEVRLLQLQLADEESAATAAIRARIAAEERERFAQDLHDSVIQQLFASALQLSSLSDLMPEGVQQGTVLTVARTLTDVIAEIRRGIEAVRKEVPSSLQRELEDAVSLIASAAGVHCTVEVGPDVEVEGEIRSNLRAAVRESVTNAVRHGHGATVKVGVYREGYHVVMCVCDDGVGFPVDLERSSGLSNLRRRAEQLGGVMSVGDGEDGGTVVTWRVPMPVGEEN
jgi:signal transduction histidine kinase